MRVLFAGSPSIGSPCLEALLNLQLQGGFCTLAGVLTNPDNKRGRSGKYEPTDISLKTSELSERLKAEGCPPIPQLKPEKLDDEARSFVAALKPDLLVSFAYGKIFGPKFLSLFSLGGINIHPSLLPKYRGASPIPTAILNREGETGISIQTLAPQMDEGDILLQERFPLNGRETTESLSALVSLKAGEMLNKLIKGFYGIEKRPQVHSSATFCFRMEKSDGRIYWTDSAEKIDAQIRAFYPWPLAWTESRGQNLYIIEASPYNSASQEKNAGTVLGADKDKGILVQTGSGVLGVTRLQYQAKKVLDWRSFLNGAKDFINTSLG